MVARLMRRQHRLARMRAATGPARPTSGYAHRGGRAATGCSTRPRLRTAAAPARALLIVRRAGLRRARFLLVGVALSGGRSRRFESCRARSGEPALRAGFRVDGAVRKGIEPVPNGQRRGGWCPSVHIHQRGEPFVLLVVAAHRVGIDRQCEGGIGVPELGHHFRRRFPDRVQQRGKPAPEPVRRQRWNRGRNRIPEPNRIAPGGFEPLTSRLWIVCTARERRRSAVHRARRRRRGRAPRRAGRLLRRDEHQRGPRHIENWCGTSAGISIFPVTWKPNRA